MAVAERQAKRRKEAVAPYLDEGEVVKASFLGQMPIPPWVFFLIAPWVFVFMQKYRTVAATDRHVYVMQNGFLRSYKYNGVAHKARRGSAQIEFEGTWVSIDGGPKLRVPPFGPIKGAFEEFRAELAGDTDATAPADPPSPNAP